MKKAFVICLISLVFPCLLFLFLFVAIMPEDAPKSSGDGAGYNLPLFVTDDMMEAFFETQKDHGIPVSSGIAQLIAESGFGIYGEHGDSGQGLSLLAYQYKNLFGIKYFSGDAYAIGSKDFVTGEETSGGDITITAGFSIYKNYGDCIRQRGNMLLKEPYYSKTIALYPNKNDGKYSKKDADDFVSGIRLAGWATDSSYVEKLKQHMSTYSLYQFDNMTFAEYKAGKGTAGGNVNYDGTVTPEMMQIVNIAKNNQGTYPCTPDMCAAWVTGVYQAAGMSAIPYGNAIDMWNSYSYTGNTSQDNIPPGAVVCGSGAGYMGSIYGHVGVYLGDGMVANNIGVFSVETLEGWCSWQTANCQGNVGWIGWVYPGGVPGK